MADRVRILYRDELPDRLANGMFRDRAQQFGKRLGWPVTVDRLGRERDEYDELNPIYVIWQADEGHWHRASMRVLPTVGRTMTADHFRHLTDGVRIESPLIWECTRFCLAPGATSREAAGVLYGGLELGLRFGLEQALGVFDARMPRVYARLGHEPTIVGSAGGISVGLWEITREAQERIAERAGLDNSLFEETGQVWIRSA